MRDRIFWPPAKELAERFGVDITTARRWRREQNAPLAVMMLLAEDLGCFHKSWAGWVIRDGKLVSPECLELTMGEVRAIPFMRMQIQSYQLDARLAAKAPQIDEQPTPEQWDMDIMRAAGAI